MLQRGLVKCSSLLFIMFLMCPRRIRPTAVTKPDYFYAVKKSNDEIDLNDVNLRSGPSEWNNVFKSDEDDYALTVDEEPGFNLNDDEIRKFKLWPKGIIYYYIDAVSFDDKVLRDRIRLSLYAVNKLTRLSFLELPAPPKDDKTRWVFFANRRGELDCGDHSVLNFTNVGVQHVILGYDCLLMDRELAEAVLSIAGVPNQHNAPNRDKFIEVIQRNIVHEKKYLYKKLRDEEWLFHNVEYDVFSASHFGQHRYSRNGQATIKIREKAVHKNKPKEYHGFSKIDIHKIRMLYNYIVKKKENKVPECDKLFKKGQNFKPLHLPEVKPRKKPDKYLGVDKGNQSQLKNFYGGFLESDEAGIEQNYQETAEEGKIEEYAGETVNYEDENFDRTNVKMDLKSHPMKMNYKSYKIDPLLYLSDYQTGDEYRKKWKSTEKYNFED